MLQHPTLDQLRHLKLHGMARAFAELGDNAQACELDHAQWLALLLDREEAERDDRRLTYRLRNARLRHPPTPASRTSTTGPPGASTKPCSSNSPEANGSPANKT
jgi:DNA replication protein DnaC